MPVMARPGRDPPALRDAVRPDHFRLKVARRSAMVAPPTSGASESHVAFTVFSSTSPVRVASGSIVNYVAVKRDITDHLRLTSQFQQTQKMETVGTLAGGIAHGFNNILTAIIGFGEMLKRRIAKDPKALSDLDQILHSVERASVLTRQLLIFARRQVIELGNLDLNRVVIDLEKLLRRSQGQTSRSRPSWRKTCRRSRPTRGRWSRS